MDSEVHEEDIKYLLFINFSMTHILNQRRTAKGAYFSMAANSWINSCTKSEDWKYYGKMSFPDKKNIEELREKISDFIVQEQPIYNRFLEALENGKDIETLTEESTQLQEIRDQNQKEIHRRIFSHYDCNRYVRIFEKTSAFLRTMTPKQEQNCRSP